MFVCYFLHVWFSAGIVKTSLKLKTCMLVNWVQLKVWIVSIQN